MRACAGAASPLHAAALLLVLLAARLSVQGIRNTTTTMTSAKLSTSGPRITSNTTTQSPSNTSAHDTNVTFTTTLDSTKAVSTTKTATTATITTQTTKSSTTSKPSTTMKSITNVTMTTSKTMSPSTSITATPKSAGALAKTSSFDVGSFVGGIVLTLGMLALLYIGCKTYHSRRGVQYRTIDEHDAII
ncbi:porimin [Emydura macquarii macquarii]|uniref:porimin n=1 Tax=Emydura macquarii macquarii TaxID=1129001 RepID=UPI003529DEF9